MIKVYMYIIHHCNWIGSSDEYSSDKAADWTSQSTCVYNLLCSLSIEVAHWGLGPQKHL